LVINSKRYNKKFNLRKLNSFLFFTGVGVAQEDEKELSQEA